jgi:hypothetical protein
MGGGECVLLFRILIFGKRDKNVERKDKKKYI